MTNEPSIQVSLTSKEYRTLIELAYLGEWLVNSHHDAEFQDETMSASLQHLLGAHALAGVGRDVETGDYYLEPEWHERLIERFIADYDDHVFWDELAERLAQRDLARVQGVSIDEIDRDEHLAELRPLEEHYRQELEDHGLDRLEIRDTFQ